MACGGAQAVSAPAEKYTRFHGYKFDDDVAFMRGWERVSSAKQTSEDDKLNAKLFYYSKKFEPVSQKEYKEWLEDRGHAGSMKEQGRTKETCSDHRAQASSDPEQLEGSNSGSQGTPTQKEHAKGNNSSEPTTDTLSSDAESVEAVLNFQELMECLQEGRPIPGIKKVNAAPTFSDPTPSSLDRPQKPWEKR